jgi:hypothetical protein
VAELHHPGEVGVPGARKVDLLDRLLDGPGVHALGPVLVVAVGDQQRDGTAQRAPVPDAGPDLRAVGFDLHPPPTAMPELAARQVAVDVAGSDLEARGQPLDHGHEAGAVRLAGRREPQG